jgi:hypothetical protein
MFLNGHRLERIELGVQHVLKSSGSRAQGECEIQCWVFRHYYSEGLRPSDSPTRSLASRCAGSLRLRLR